MVAAGWQCIKLSNKAKRSAGIDTDDEGHDSKDKNSNVGSKCKSKGSSANANAPNKKQRPNEVPKKKTHHTKTIVIVSDDDQLDLEETPALT